MSESSESGKNIPTESVADPAVHVRPEHERMLKHFAFKHLSGELQNVSRLFGDMAVEIVAKISPGPERTVCLRKLLEAKDCAVRATVFPGG